MLEIVHAHASYRFVIRDEEAEEIRILVSSKYRRLPLNELMAID